VKCYGLSNQNRHRLLCGRSLLRCLCLINDEMLNWNCPRLVLSMKKKVHENEEMVRTGWIRPRYITVPKRSRLIKRVKRVWDWTTYMIVRLVLTIRFSLLSSSCRSSSLKRDKVLASFRMRYFLVVVTLPMILL